MLGRVTALDADARAGADDWPRPTRNGAGDMVGAGKIGLEAVTSTKSVSVVVVVSVDCVV